MAKKKYRRAKKNSAIPIAIMAPLAVPVIRAYQQTGTIGAKADRLTRSITGVTIDGKDFNAADAMPFWTAMVGGIIVHKVASNKKVNVNKYVRKASMGFFEL